MRIVLSVLKWLAIFLALALLAIAVLPQLPVARDALGKGEYEAFLEAEAVPLDLAEPDAGLSFEPSFYEHALFMLNEIHGYADVQKLDLAMLRHLHEKLGIRTYYAELSPAQAMAFNAYVLDGDDGPARLVFDTWSESSTQWGNKEFFAKLGAVRVFNQAQPDQGKIVFVGVDTISGTVVPEEFVNRPWPSEVPSFNDLASIRAVNDLLLKNALLRPADAGRYQHILDNSGLLKALPGAAGEKFYGLWGLFHGGQVEINGFKPLAMRLAAEGGHFEGQVATVSSLCVSECFNMMPARALPSPLQGPEGEAFTLLPMTFDNPYLARMRGLGEVMEAMGEADGLLIPTRHPDSPYTDGPRLVTQTGFIATLQSFEYDGAAADASDAFIAHQGSRGLTPWQGEAFDITGEALRP